MLTLKHAGQALSRCNFEYVLDGEAGGKQLATIRRPRLFETSFTLAQLRLFTLGALGEGRWLKALKLQGYAPRSLRHSRAFKGAVPYLEALGYSGSQKY